MTPEISAARQNWINTERVIGLGALIGCVVMAFLLFPGPLPESPSSLLARDITGTPDCPSLENLGTRQVNVEAELARLVPDFTDAMLQGADISGQKFVTTSFRNANLAGANINGTTFDSADLACAGMYSVVGDENTKFLISDLSGAKFSDASLAGADFTLSTLIEADFTGANLSDAILDGANLSGAVLDSTDLSGARMNNAKVSFADYRAVGAPNVGAAATVAGLALMRPSQPDFAGLRLLANAYDDAGLNAQSRDVTAVIARWERYHLLNKDPRPTTAQSVMIHGSALLFGWISADGSQPLRPLWLLTVATTVFALLYWVLISLTKPTVLLTYRVTAGGQTEEECPLPHKTIQKIPPAVVLSLSNALLIAVPIFNVLSHLEKIVPQLAPYKSHGYLRWIATSQAILTGMLLLNWILFE